MFYLTTHSTHFIYGYMASDIWLRTILIVRKETRCHHIGYSYRLTAWVLLYAPSHRQDSTYHGLCYTSRGALAGTRLFFKCMNTWVESSEKVNVLHTSSPEPGECFLTVPRSYTSHGALAGTRLFFKCMNTWVESSEKVNVLHTSSPEPGECFLTVPRSYTSRGALAGTRLFFKCMNTWVESSENVNVLHTSSPEPQECFLIVPRSTNSIAGISWGTTIQYLVGPPWALTTDTHLLYMEWIRWLIKAIGIAAHFLRQATLRSASVSSFGHTSLSFLWIWLTNALLVLDSNPYWGQAMAWFWCCAAGESAAGHCPAGTCDAGDSQNRAQCEVEGLDWYTAEPWPHYLYLGLYSER